MKKILFSLSFTLILIGCSDFYNPVGVTYESFNGTPVEELADYMESGDIDNFKQQIKLDYKSINYKEKEYKKTLLHMATYYQLDEFVLVLLKYKANPEIEMLGEETPLILACSRNSFQIVKYLISFGADVNHSTVTETDKVILSPLLEACASNEPNSYKIAKLLIDNHADVDFGNDVKFPMQEAIIYENMETVKYLLLKGANYERIFLDGKEYDPKNGKTLYMEDFMEYSLKETSSKRIKKNQKEIISILKSLKQKNK